MKREEIPFYVYGFSDSEIALLGQSAKHLQIIPVTGNTIRSWLEKPEVAICVIHIVSEEDLNTFRQLRIEYPVHSWGACVDLENISLFSRLLYREKFVLFLYPLQKETLSITIQRLLKGIYKGRIQASLNRGMRVMHQSYRWQTNEIEIQAVAQHIGNQLAMGGYCIVGQDKDAVVLAVEEALINAVEHGNLELDSSLKDEDIMGLKYEEEKVKRLLLPKYYYRNITIELSIDRDVAKCEIINEGPVFDYKKELENASSINNYEKASGKGLFLIKRVFDRIIYSDGGKSLTLVKLKIAEEHE